MKLDGGCENFCQLQNNGEGKSCSASLKHVFFCGSFRDADIRETLKENVRKTHYDKPTPIQKWAIPVILSGRDLMGCAQTGSGKTVSWHIVNFCRKILNLIGHGHG